MSATFFKDQIWSFSPVGPHSLCVPPQRCIWSSGRAVTRVWQVGPYHPPNLTILRLLLLLLCTGPYHPPDLAPSNCTTTPHPQWRSLPVSLLANKTGRYITMILPKSGGGGKSLSRPGEPQALLQVLNSESTDMLSFLRSLGHLWQEGTICFA